MTLIMLSDKTIKTQFSKFGFKTFDKKCIEHINNMILSYIKHIIEKGKQDGGRIVMPMEYCGIQTSEYHESPGPYHIMNATSDFIRPPMGSTFGQDGGSLLFKISKNDISSFIEEVSKDYKVQNKTKLVAKLQKEIQEKLSEFLRMVKTMSKKKPTHVDESIFKTVLNKRIFKMFIHKSLH